MFQDYMLAGATEEHHEPIKKVGDMSRNIFVNKKTFELCKLLTDLCMKLEITEPSEQCRPDDVS